MMKAPENLVAAVRRLEPQAMLLLDTNTVMDNPRLDSYEINALGRFLLVVPNVVDGELMGLRHNQKPQTQRKASRACNVTSELYKRGEPADGIGLGNDLWLITADSPRPPESSTVEDDQVRRNLGKVDAALLRLAAASAKGCPDTRVLLITKDNDLTRVTRTRGLSACPLRDLRSPEALAKILDTPPSETIDIKKAASQLIDPENERPVGIQMTLEELRSEGADLVARGSGRLEYDERRYPFRWTFPFSNMGRYKDWWNIDIHQIEDNLVMPIGNLDFMGADEQLPEPVKYLACRMLEDSGGWSSTRSLQSPLTLLRFNVVWHSEMGSLRCQPFRRNAEAHKQFLSQAEAEKYDELSIQHDQHLESLLDGTAESVGRIYRSVFQLSEALEHLMGWEDEWYGPNDDCDPTDLESVLIYFLDIAMSTWSVGETQTEEFVFRPFA